MKAGTGWRWLGVVVWVMVCAFGVLGADDGGEVVRFDFEAGMQGWRIVEGGFGKLHCDRDRYHNGGDVYNKQGAYFLSTLETNGNTPNDGFTGVVESPVFELLGERLTFLVGGGNGAGCYVGLYVLDDDMNAREVRAARGANTEVMQRVEWDLPELVGKKVFLRLVDRETGGWGHITFDDFMAMGRIDKQVTAQRVIESQGDIGFASARKAIEDLVGMYGEVEYPKGVANLKLLDEYEEQYQRILELYAQDETLKGEYDEFVEEVKGCIREILISNPMVSSQPILFVVRQQYARDHHNTHTFFPSYDNEMNDGRFTPGGAMKVVDFGGGGEDVRTLIEVPEGIVRDPDVDYDGERIVFAKRKNWDDNYSIWQMNVDGTGLVELTGAERVTDIDPAYLPDGTIVFASTREPKYVHCNRHIMCNLYRMNGDGGNIYQISRNTLFDSQCSVMSDGRVMYSRWEYVDRNFGDAQGVWTANPDGTNHAVYFGNNTAAPGAIMDAREIPGTTLMVAIFGGCHDRPWGAMAVVDRRYGVDLPAEQAGANPVRQIWPAGAIDVMGGWNGDKPVPGVSGGGYGFDNTVGLPVKYEDPYPLYDPCVPGSGGTYFLVSRMIGQGEKMGLYLVDVFGNEVLLHEEEGAMGCFDPMPIVKRERGAVWPETRGYGEEAVGQFYIADVYEGTHMDGVRAGEVASLRVLEATEKKNWTYRTWDGQGIEGPGMAWHDFYSKKILGTVPVEADGSAYFEVPAERLVYFQLLDKDGRMIQSMRSGTLVQPGEVRGCVGCHESRLQAGAGAKGNGAMPLAVKRGADEMHGWRGKTEAFNYLRDVQPVFTRRCVSCHGFDTPGGAKKGLLLEGDKTVYFNTSYNELWRKGYTGAIGAGPAPVQKAKSWGSSVSRLVRALDKKQHKEIGLTADERERIVTWVDLNGPYYPVYTSAYAENAAGRSPLTDGELARLEALTGKSLGMKQAAVVSFDRPEKSLCLVGLSGDKYAEALGIIREGKTRLEERPRADMAGHVPGEVDTWRLEKYAERRAIEAANREAIRDGLMLYDYRVKKGN